MFEDNEDVTKCFPSHLNSWTDSWRNVDVNAFYFKRNGMFDLLWIFVLWT